MKNTKTVRLRHENVAVWISLIIDHVLLFALFTESLFFNDISLSCPEEPHINHLPEAHLVPFLEWGYLLISQYHQPCHCISLFLLFFQSLSVDPASFVLINNITKRSNAWEISSGSSFDVSTLQRFVLNYIFHLWIDDGHGLSDLPSFNPSPTRPLPSAATRGSNMINVNDFSLFFLIYIPLYWQKFSVSYGTGSLHYRISINYSCRWEWWLNRALG